MRRALAAVRRGVQPEMRVPAGPSRRRLGKLRARGLSLRAVAELTGVSVGALQHIQQGRSRVSLVTAQRLEAVVR